MFGSPTSTPERLAHRVGDCGLGSANAFGYRCRRSRSIARQAQGGPFVVRRAAGSRRPSLATGARRLILCPGTDAPRRSFKGRSPSNRSPTYAVLSDVVRHGTADRRVLWE